MRNLIALLSPSTCLLLLLGGGVHAQVPFQFVAGHDRNFSSACDRSGSFFCLEAENPATTDIVCAANDNCTGRVVMTYPTPPWNLLGRITATPGYRFVATPPNDGSAFVPFQFTVTLRNTQPPANCGTPEVIRPDTLAAVIRAPDATPCAYQLVKSWNSPPDSGAIQFSEVLVDLCTLKLNFAMASDCLDDQTMQFTEIRYLAGVTASSPVTGAFTYAYDTKSTGMGGYGGKGTVAMVKDPTPAPTRAPTPAPTPTSAAATPAGAVPAFLLVLPLAAWLNRLLL